MSNPNPKAWMAHSVMGKASPHHRDLAFSALDREIRRAYRLHGCPLWGRHEAHAIIREEFEEAWDVIKADGAADRLLKELIHTAAMCVRYIETDPIMQQCMDRIEEGATLPNG